VCNVAVIAEVSGWADCHQPQLNRSLSCGGDLTYFRIVIKDDAACWIMSYRAQRGAGRFCLPRSPIWESVIAKNLLTVLLARLLASHVGAEFDKTNFVRIVPNGFKNSGFKTVLASRARQSDLLPNNCRRTAQGSRGSDRE